MFGQYALPNNSFVSLFQYADIVDLMAQGPAEELEKLKGPLADFGPAYYPLAEGSLRSKKKW